MQKITDRLHLTNRHQKAQQTAPLKPTSAPLNAQGQPVTTVTSTTLGTNTPLQQQGWNGQQGLQQGGLQQGGLQQGGLQQGGLQQGGLQQGGLQQGGLQQGGLQQGGFQQGWNGQQGLQQGGLQQGGLQQQQGWNGQQGLQQGGLQQQGWNGQQQGWNGQQQGWSGQQGLQQGLQQPTLLTTTRPALVETHVRPAIVEQTTRINKVVEIQPIIHREIDAPQVRIIEQHSYESAPLSGPGLVTMAPIVEETIRPTVVEEIQPILHREVPAPFIERVEQHTTENVVAPTTTTRQVMSESRTLGLQEATQRGFVSAPLVQPVNQAPILNSHVAAPVMESITRNTIIQQTARPEKITEVQPIIHREIDAPQVRVIEQHSFEQVRSTGPSLINLQPIVEEKIQPIITEEIQTVLHREVPAPFIERVEQHTQERVVAPTTTTTQVLSEHSVAAGVPLLSQQQLSQPTAPILRSTTALPTTQLVNHPAIIQQTSRPEKITEVQPVIHRQIDAPQVRVIEQHTYERERSAGPSVFTNAPIVEETIVPTIIEEIQPVIHREVPQTVIEHQEQHTTERVVQPTTTTRQVLQDRVTKALPAVPRAVAPVSTTPILHTTTAATEVQSHTNATLIQQTSRPEKITEVQPVIHRQIDAPQVRVIEQHMYEKVPSSGPSVITKQAIIEETLHPQIIEDVQTVVHREVPAPFIERVEQHLTEHVTQPTVSTKEVIMDRNTHFAQAGGPILPATTTSTTSTTTTTTSTLNNSGLNSGLNSGAPAVPAKRAHRRL